METDWIIERKICKMVLMELIRIIKHYLATIHQEQMEYLVTRELKVGMLDGIKMEYNSTNIFL